MLKDIRYAFRWLRRSPGFSARRDALARARRRRQHRDVLAGRFAALQAAAGLGPIHAGRHLHDQRRWRRIRHLVIPRFHRSQGAEHRLRRHDSATARCCAPLALGERSRLVVGRSSPQSLHDAGRLSRILADCCVPTDDDAGATRVVVISHRMWQRSSAARLRRSRTRRSRCAGLPYTIVGVTRPDFRGVVPLVAPDLWLPMAHVDEVEPFGITMSCRRPRAHAARTPRHALDVREGPAEARRDP